MGPSIAPYSNSETVIGGYRNNSAGISRIRSWNLIDELIWPRQIVMEISGRLNWLLIVNQWGMGVYFDF